MQIKGNCILPGHDEPSRFCTLFICHGKAVNPEGLRRGNALGPRSSGVARPTLGSAPEGVRGENLGVTKEDPHPCGCCRGIARLQDD